MNVQTELNDNPLIFWFFQEILIFYRMCNYLLLIYYFSQVIVLFIIVLVSFEYTSAFAQMMNQSDFTLSNMTTAANKTDFTPNRPAPPTDMGDFTDTGDCTTDFPSTSCIIAKTLIGLKPYQIKEYGLSDYPSSVVQNALMFLNPGNLTKVLLNLPQSELIQIRKEISPMAFNSTLSLVPEPQRSEILNKSSAG